MKPAARTFRLMADTNIVKVTNISLVVRRRVNRDSDSGAKQASVNWFYHIHKNF